RLGAHRLTGELALRRCRETAAGGTVEWFVEDRAQSLPSGYLCCGRRHRRRRSARTRAPPRSTIGAARKAGGQMVRDHAPESCDRMRIMPLRAQAHPADGNRMAAWALIVEEHRRGLRGKNGSALQLGTHKRQCTEWHDDENLAILSLRNDLIPVPVSVLHNRVR